MVQTGHATLTCSRQENLVLHRVAPATSNCRGRVSREWLPAVAAAVEVCPGTPTPGRVGGWVIRSLFRDFETFESFTVSLNPLVGMFQGLSSRQEKNIPTDMFVRVEPSRSLGRTPLRHSTGNFVTTHTSWKFRRKRKRPHVTSLVRKGRYKGTSLKRNAHLPRTTVGPKAGPYCRVPGCGCFL